MTRAACTIVSLNYLAYARTLCDSFLAFHPDCKFYVLIVDRLPSGCNLANEQFEAILVEDLGISGFGDLAFKYDILELNTNVKPTLLKSLLLRGIDEIVYLDPDIRIYQALEPVFDVLLGHAIVLTPHSLSPVDDGGKTEQLLLMGGTFNLGFVAVRRSDETNCFLNWWEERCLNLAYDELRAGLFVDQKWLNLAPCFFPNLAILRHPGCNVAYWNLHERHLSLIEGSWFVNGVEPLIFFHFSGVSVDGGEMVSKYVDRFTFTSRPDLRPIFQDYRCELIQHGIHNGKAHPYAFGYFDNGQFINRLTRSLFAANLDRFSGGDPFRGMSLFYSWAKSAGILDSTDSFKNYTSKSYVKKDARIRAVNLVLRIALRILGANRYTVLMKYLSFVSILRNQRDVFGA